MKFYEAYDGRIKTEDQLRDIFAILTGEEYFGKDFENDVVRKFSGIKREVTDFTEWKKFALRSQVSGMMLYRALTGCGLVEAKNAVEEYLAKKEELNE